MSLKPAPVAWPGHDDAPERDEPERLSADDLASKREEEFLAAALDAHRRQAAAAATAHVPGRCSNCGERVRRTEHYCDTDCRDDHQRRQRARARR